MMYLKFEVAASALLEARGFGYNGHKRNVKYAKVLTKRPFL